MEVHIDARHPFLFPLHGIVICYCSMIWLTNLWAKEEEKGVPYYPSGPPLGTMLPPMGYPGVLMFPFSQCYGNVPINVITIFIQKLRIGISGLDFPSTWPSCYDFLFVKFKRNYSCLVILSALLRWGFIKFEEQNIKFMAYINMLLILDVHVMTSIVFLCVFFVVAVFQCKFAIEDSIFVNCWLKSTNFKRKV